MINYKGLFYKEDSKKPNYEGGAHFKYKDLVRALESLKIQIDEEEKQHKNSRNKLVDIYQENISLKNKKNNFIRLDNHYNNFDSPKKTIINNNNYNKDEQLLSLDNIKLYKRRNIKLKEIKTDKRKKELISLYTENNRYKYNNDDNKRYKSLDIKIFDEKKSNNKNKIILTGNKNDNQNFSNLKLLINSNPKSYKNFSIISSLPKIESLYLNNISKKNLIDNNSNMATNSTNKKNEFSELKTRMENEIYKNINMPDFHFFLFKKKLPQLNNQSISNNNNYNSNKNIDKNKLLFFTNKNNKKESSTNNNIKEIKDIKKNEKENDNIMKNINLNKNKYKKLKLAIIDKDKNKDLKNNLHSD